MPFPLLLFDPLIDLQPEFHFSLALRSYLFAIHAAVIVFANGASDRRN